MVKDWEVLFKRDWELEFLFIFNHYWNTMGRDEIYVLKIFSHKNKQSCWYNDVEFFKFSCVKRHMTSFLGNPKVTTQSSVCSAFMERLVETTLSEPVRPVAESNWGEHSKKRKHDKFHCYLHDGSFINEDWATECKALSKVLTPCMQVII